MEQDKVILAEASILNAKALYSSLGKLILVKGITPETPELSQAQVLISRTTLRIDEDLLRRAPNLEYIACPFVGKDNIDFVATGEAGIEVILATGSNAASVADLVFYTVLPVMAIEGRSLSGQTIGVVGYGHTGEETVKRAQAFGMEYLVHSPGRMAEVGDVPNHVSLNDLLRRSDLVSLHTESTDSKFHMIGTEQLGYMRDGTYLVNTARGALVDTEALIAELERERIGAILDVYEKEPDPKREVIELATMSLPHIAGKALDARVEGPRVISEELHKRLNKPYGVDEAALFAELPNDYQQPVIFTQTDDENFSADSAVRALMFAAHNIRRVSDEFRVSMLSETGADPFKAARDGYTKNHPRRLLSSCKVAVDVTHQPLAAQITQRLAGFGIEIVTGDGIKQAHYVISPETIN